MANGNNSKKSIDDYFGPQSEESKKKTREMSNEYNPYISLKDGESIDLVFDFSRIEKVDDNFDKTKKRDRFHVYSPAKDGEFIWDAPKSVAAKVTQMNADFGTRFFHIEREGQQKDTRYKVTPAK